MRKRSILAFLLITISVSSFAPAQTTYRVPRAVKLDPVVRKALPNYYRGDGIASPETNGFFPIGWSRDGKFAYYVEPVDEACGCYFAELRIQDLRTDKILWEFKNDPESRTNADGSPIDDDINKLWRRNRKLFNEKLREYGIRQYPRFSLLPNKFTSGGKTYTAKLIARKEHDEDFDTGRVRNIKLELSSPTLGTKTVYSADNKGEMYLSPLEAAVVGAIKSPFEGRAAIVMINLQRGWEGPPHTVDIRIAGADLTNGFKR